MSSVYVLNKGAIQAIVTIYNVQTGVSTEVFIQPGSRISLPAYHRVHQNSFVQHPKLVETVEASVYTEVASTASVPTSLEVTSTATSTAPSSSDDASEPAIAS